MRQAVLNGATLVSGAALQLVPTAIVSVASRLYGTTEQGWIAVAVMIATFAGQLAFSVVVESRLGSVGTQRRVVFPRWLGLFAIAAAAAVAAASGSVLAGGGVGQVLAPLVICAALPVLLSSLEVGRGVSVAELLHRREFASSAFVGAGAVAGVAAGFLGQWWAPVPIVAGVVGAALVRMRPVAHRPSPAQASVRGWIVLDTTITGVIYPVMNAVVLTSLGPADAVVFTAVSSVSGLLGLPLNFLRLRLLKEHSPLDILLASLASLGAVVVLVGLDLTGVLGLIFGQAWSSGSTALVLIVACAWRAASLPTTIPFAALRRLGRARLVTVLRAFVSAGTFGLAMLALLAGGNLLVLLLALLFAELASAVVYEIARRRVTARLASAP